MQKLKRTCNGCKAHVVTSYQACTLGHKQGSLGRVKFWPLEDCPKPVTGKALSDVLWSRRKGE